MEILKGYTADVRFPVPTDLTELTSATVSGSGLTTTPAEATATDGVAVVLIPYSAVQEERDLEVTITFEYQGTTYNRTKTVSVATPLLDSWEIDEIIMGEDVDTWDIEKAVRQVINAHTGQTFGKFTGTKYALGNGENTLALPARLMSLTDISLDTPGLGLYGNFQIAGDGWYLKPTLFPKEGYSIKADASDYAIGVNGVIYNPFGRSAGAFQKDVRYAVDGVWGYNEVPEAVREAAKLLVNDYASMDSAYRDKYLISLTSPDWRIQFHSGAFRQTGNVRADQLLAEYVLKRGWAVI